MAIVLTLSATLPAWAFAITSTSSSDPGTENARISYENGILRIGLNPETLDRMLDDGKISYVISTSAKGRIPQYDSVKIRRKTVERSICCLTAIDTANAVADILAMGKKIDDMEMVDITKI